MLLSELTKGAHVKLPVDKDASRENFFTVYTDDEYREVFTLPKLKFQLKEPIPDSLDLYVKESKDGYVSLGQDLSTIIARFYREGDEYLFKVKGKKLGKNGSYEVEDENGLYFTLNNAPEGLARGKALKCKVVKINNVYVLLKYAGVLSKKVKLEFRDVREWLSTIQLDEDIDVVRNIVEKTLENISDLYPALDQLKQKDADWIFTLFHIFSQNVTKFLIEAKNSSPQRVSTRKMARIRKFMRMVERICLYIIQKSDYLKGCSPDQRAELQASLSGYVEMFRQYEEAAELIANSEDETFIDSIFENLKQSGYLYHPSEQFRIMMTILRLRPDLIKSRLTNLFEALHSWPLANWKDDPFRSALVDQLEIYISENCDDLNSVPMSESQVGATDKQLTHIVRSIAIQSLLVKPTDKIDMSHNKSMFYRFLSNFRIQDVDDLLYKAVGSIMGNEYKGDFSWEDTSKFQLLQEKASTFKNSNVDVPLPPKVYTLQNATIELRPRELSIRERFPQDENSVLPNNLISWMSPKIILSERVRTPNAAKKNDLKAYEEMWNDIENYLFPASDPDATMEIQIKKMRPEDGERVEIIIDDCQLDMSRSEGHRLRFHCTVVSEEFEGSGWLTACPEDFVAWLDEKDYPRNYDGNLDIFRDERGVPLVFPAVVKNSGEELHFSMKSEIDNHLRETASFNEMSQAVIRHVDTARRKYVCLSDNGYTLLCDIDETNNGFKPGTVVKVRNLGMSPYLHGGKGYMSGSIVEFVRSDDCYTKLPPLRGIMQTMGIPQEMSAEEAESEVIEAQEVMSREEMREVILMLQRRAYAEKEYLQAFNYLGLAALLSKAIDDNGLRDEIKLHQRLLSQLQYYARNREVDYEELAKHKEEVAGNAILLKLYTKLDIVASISRPERNTRLWELTMQEDETERRLASLVLSLNMLPEEDSFETVRKNLNSEIAKILNVNSTETHLKYYGEEDQHQEFKSSLVFTNKKEDHMAARREAQEREILEIICGFLNSQGGTLYIGVNDLGYEAGLAEDLRYRRSRGRKATLDGMRVDLGNLVFNTLGSYADSHVVISIDPEAQKGVLVVKVDAVERPISLEGKYYVRHSTSTRYIDGENLKLFLETRTKDFNDYQQRQRIALLEQEKARQEEEMRQSLSEKKDQGTPGPEKTAESEPDDHSPSPVLPPASSPNEETTDGVRIQTGRHRPNILHDYDMGFVHPAFYLHFNTDNTYYITKDDQYNEFDDDKRMVLSISDSELDDMLICTFEDGTVCRTPLREFMENDFDRKVEHWSESPLTAVNVAPKDKVLLTFLVNTSTNTLHVRIDNVEELTMSHKLRSGGKRLTENDYRIISQDVCSADKAKFCIPKIAELSKKHYGAKAMLNPTDTIPDFIEHYTGLIIDEA